MRYLSVCSGIEAASVWAELGWQCAGVAEIEPFPCQVLAQRLGASRPRYMPDPDAAGLTTKEAKHRRNAIKAMDGRHMRWGSELPNFGDFTQIREDDVGPIDLLVGGTPCFPAGTMIATMRGFTPIEEVVVGDYVWTHEHRFRRVVRAGSKASETVVVRGQGHFGITTTANHRFLARRKTARSTRVAGRAVRITDRGTARWIPAENLVGAHWACVAKWPSSPIPPIETIGNERSVTPSIDIMRLAGAYLGDGWVSVDSRRGYVKLGLNNAKLDQLKPTLDAIGAWSASKQRRLCTLRHQWDATPFAA